MSDYYKTKESVDEYIELAKDVNSEELILKMKQFLPEGSTLLELGSGPGTDWKILNKNYEVTGSDFSEEFLVRLRANNPEGRFIQIDAKEINTSSTFDGIYANKVLHLFNVDELKQSIQGQLAILNEGGVFCHSYWKGEGSETFKGMFVQYHLENDLKSIYEADSEILLLESYTEFDDGDSIVIIGKKK